MIVRKLSPCIYFFLRGGPFPAYEHYRLYLSTLPELKTGHIGRSEQQYVSTLIWCILSLLRKRNRVYIHHARFHTLKMKVDDFLRVFVLKPFLQSSKRKNQEMNCIFTYLPSIHISSLTPKKEEPRNELLCHPRCDFSILTLWKPVPGSQTFHCKPPLKATAKAEVMGRWRPKFFRW